MVKELTMDNTIFGLGSAKNMNAVESNVDMSSNEFEKVFETTQYADKSELKADNQKVLKAAEKSVSRENDSLKKDAATDITRVNKKVSAKLTSKSPKNAGLDSSTTSNVRSQKELDTTSNAYSFSVKESLNVEEKISTEPVVEATEVVESVVEDVEVALEADVQQEEVTLDSVEVGSSEEVVNLESSNPQTVENVAVVAQNVVAEIVKTVEEKVSALTVNTDEEAEETTANILDAVELVENTDELLEEGLSLDILSDKELEITSNTTTELESDAQVLTQQLSDVEEKNVDNSKIELGEGWEVVAEDEQLLTKEELESIVSKDMSVLNVEDVKPHTLEEIEAGKEKALDFAELDKQVVADEDVQVVLDTELQDVEVVEQNSLATDEQELISLNPQLEDENVELEVAVKDSSVDFVKEESVNQAVLNKVEQELNLESDKNISLESKKDVVFNELNKSVEEDVLSSVDLETDLQPVETVINNVENIEVEQNTVVQEEISTDVEQEDIIVNLEDDKIIVQEQNVVEQEDLDAYIDNCIKLAYVEPAVKQTQEQDVISALESKFAEDIQIEENIEYASSDDEMFYDDEDVATEVGYEQVASLDELVDVEEVDDLKLQLKEQVSVMSEKTTIASSSNSTTEQMIRFAIEGETGFEPAMQLSNTFKPQATLSQQTFQPVAKDVLAQLSEKLATFNLNAGSKLTMQLSPENLGKIEISLTNTAKGVVAEMMVSSDDTCELMKKNIEDLKETLQKYGVRFDNVTVKTAPSQQSSSNQDYTEQQGNAHKQNHEQKREEKNNGRSFDDTFSSFTEEQDEE